MTNLVAVSDIQTMANAVAKSNLFGVKNAEQAMSLMLIAQAEGMHPAIAARDYHVIQGRPTLKADAMLARFQAAGGKVQWGDYGDEKVTGTFSHALGGSVTITWTFHQAQKIGLTGKDNWKNYPRQMLRARVISEGVRAVFPGVAVGVYTPEEVQDAKPGERMMGDAEVITDKVTDEQLSTLRDLLTDADISEADLCKVPGIARIEDMLEVDFEGATKWIAKQKAKKQGQPA